MGFKEAFGRYIQKKKEEKEEFKEMQKRLRLERKLEQKFKTPAQKEYEFYQRERAKESLNKELKRLRKMREEKLKKLSSPLNRKPLFSERLDIKDGGIKWF